MAFDLQLSNVGKVFDNGTAAVIDFNLDVNKGEFIAFLGPSGCGKTTTLRMIAGFEDTSSGDISIRGKSINHLLPEQRPTSMIFQNYALFPHMTVRENVGFGLDVKGMAPAERNAKVSRMLETLGLSGVAGHRPDRLSGGQRQRIALARSLVVEPDILLLDEPLGALDANLRGRMRNELRAIRERLGVTFLHVTGSETEALAMGDRVIVLDHGHIAQFDNPDHVYTKPATPNVAKFLNRYNVFDGSIAGLAFKSEYGDLAFTQKTKFDRPAYAVRYDRVAVEAGNTTGKGPSVQANFIASEYLGSSIMYFFEASGGKVIEVEHHLSNGSPKTFEPKKSYRLRWKPEDAIVFG